MLVGCRMASWTNKIKDDQTNSFIAIILERPVQKHKYTCTNPS